jgi:hypothetical protein
MCAGPTNLFAVTFSNSTMPECHRNVSGANYRRNTDMREKPETFVKTPRGSFDPSELARDIGAACKQALGPTGTLYVLLSICLLGLGLVSLVLDFLPTASVMLLGAASMLAMLGAFVSWLRGGKTE